MENEIVKNKTGKKRDKKNKAKNKGIWLDSLKQSFTKLSPRVQIKNPVMFVVYIGAIMTTALYILSFLEIRDESGAYTLAITLILWFTVLFANFAEAIAEGRGRGTGGQPSQCEEGCQSEKTENPGES